MLILFPIGLLLVLLLATFIRRSILREDVWSISIYAGDSPLALRPIGSGPVLKGSDIAEVATRFVADPFLVRATEGWYMFFEALESATRRGVIGVASSADGLTWRNARIVLREPHHLSYPYVFEWQGTHFMIPESGDAGTVRLYRCTKFPDQWRFDRELLIGAYRDASIVRRDGRWWLFAMREPMRLELHHAEELYGPWVSHPANPLVADDIHVARPGGRLVEIDGRLLRFAQDGAPTYGSSVRALQVDVLTTSSYQEHEISAEPILTGCGSGWNATGMHHVDAHPVGGGRWLAAVDGNRQERVFNWRAGVRSLLKVVL